MYFLCLIIICTEEVTYCGYFEIGSFRLTKMADNIMNWFYKLKQFTLFKIHCYKEIFSIKINTKFIDFKLSFYLILIKFLGLIDFNNINYLIVLYIVIINDFLSILILHDKTFAYHTVDKRVDINN